MEKLMEIRPINWDGNRVITRKMFLRNLEKELRARHPKPPISDKRKLAARKAWETIRKKRLEK